MPIAHERIELMAKAMADDDADRDWDKLSEGTREWYRNLAKAAYNALTRDYEIIVRFRQPPTGSPPHVTGTGGW